MRNPCDLTDFFSRWNAARQAALTPHGKPRPVMSEAEQILAVAKNDRPNVLRAVFESSRRLGKSLARYLGITVTPGDMQSWLSQSDIGCFGGRWKCFTHGHARGYKLIRSGCARPTCASAFFCDYWREAVDGLTTGLGGELRYWRHHSMGHGNENCVDIFSDRYEPTLRFYPVSQNIQVALKAIAQQLQESGITLTLHGTRESVLFYSLHPRQEPFCGPGARLIHASFARAVATCLPGMQVQDAMPMAVYGAAA